MTETRGTSRRFGIIALAAIGGIAAGLAAVYVTGGFNGNQDDTIAADQASSDCAPAVKAAGLLKPLAKGEVAAFNVATEPMSVSALSFKKADGSAVSLADFAGKTVLLNTWATWCVPCRKEMPALDRLQATSGADDFGVVAVSIDTQDKTRPQAFLEQIGVKDLTLYLDPSTKVFGDLKGKGMAVGLPTTVLVDKRGCALGVMSGPAEWDSQDAKALIDAARKI